MKTVPELVRINGLNRLKMKNFQEITQYIQISKYNFHKASCIVLKKTLSNMYYILSQLFLELTWAIDFSIYGQEINYKI